MAFSVTDHYENFPVGSLLLPRRYRPPIAAVYAFARSADDLADEGDAAPEVRLAALADYRRELAAIADGAPPGSPLFARLGEAVRSYRLPVPLLAALLDAFSQDVVKTRYANFAELLDYCRRSANPIGRLLLHLFGKAEEPCLAWSDAICSALQISNFLQDVAVDWDKGRVYLPQQDLAAFGVAESHIADRRADQRWERMMAFQTARARRMLESGAPLGQALAGRPGMEIRAVIAGGTTILNKIDAARGDVFRHRPQLGRRDWLAIVSRALVAPPTIRR